MLVNREEELQELVSSLDDHLGARWEEAVRDHLRLRTGRGELGPDVVALGPWWNEASDVEVDAVVLAGRERRPVLVAEAKWAREMDARRHVERLRRRAAVVPGVDPDVVGVAVAARGLLRDLPDDVRGISAGDVYASRGCACPSSRPTGSGVPSGRVTSSSGPTRRTEL